MPLARIITEHVEESLELAIQLRSRGFEVETVAPAQIPETPADLEIRLDTCSADEILSQVMSASADEDRNVFVAPGALNESFSAPQIRLAPPTFKRSLPESPVQSPEVTEPLFVESIHDPEPVSSSIPTEQEAPEPVIGRFNFEEVAIQEVAIQEVVIQEVATKEVAIEDGTPESIPTAAKSPSAELPSAIATYSELEELPAESGTRLTVVEAHDETPAEMSAPPTEPLITPLVRASSELKESKSRPVDTLFLRVAILAAALAAAVVVVGSLWQQSHPAAGTLPAPGGQQIPFQNVPVQKSPQVSSPASPAPVPVPPAAPVPEKGATIPSTQAPVSAKPQDHATAPPAHTAPVAPPPQVTAKKPPAKKKPVQAQHHPATHSSDSGLIAKDTVIYYNRKGTTPTQGSTSNAKQ
jgi:hypothetical protein